ncbi:MAG: uncharacterized protein KVP18_002024 [Porospora cf. gigantea A]|uniref:uncharacterized protein n=1 Tax=Porospora cf. gigantea A TaxID=2853593 RepID=UPI00355A565E|nr:MAG: hypothetical protein KVP18_002024 [Porospora cf. gigantea A]
MTKHTDVVNRFLSGEAVHIGETWNQISHDRRCPELNGRTMQAFTPFSIGKVEIPNRYVMAPMGPVGFCDMDGCFNQRGIDYYVERAKGGMGLILTGIQTVQNEVEVLIEPAVPQPNKCPPKYLLTAGEMCERVHSYGAKIFAQLTAGLGRSAMPPFVKTHVAPSEQENRFDPNLIHREMTKEEVLHYIKSFAHCAAICQKAGYDGVEIHAVHEGYLLDQFAIAFYNKRTDEFGGSLENRLRFATEIVKAVKKACGDNFPVSLRYSVKSFLKGLRQGALPGEKFVEAGRDWDEGLEAANMLIAAGYDALNVDAGTYDSWYWNHPPSYFAPGMYLPFSSFLKSNGITVPIITAGRMEDPRLTEEALKTGETDFVALGRPCLADPDIVNKIRRGLYHRVRPCVSCHDGCLGRLSKMRPLSCALNAACGREESSRLIPALEKKKVLVAGGGPAGMEFARVASIRGHEVTLVEKSSQLGGNLRVAGQPSFKHDDLAMVEWFTTELTENGVRIMLNTDYDDVKSSMKVDVVVNAIGGSPIFPEPFRQPGVLLADEVLTGKPELRSRVVVIGGGLVGCETALFLARDRDDVSDIAVVEMTEEVLGGEHGVLPFANYSMMKDLLDHHGVELMEGHKVLNVTGDSVSMLKCEDEIEGEVCSKKRISDCSVICAIGYRPNKAIEMPKDAEFYTIGDSKKVASVMAAVWDSFEVARHV